MAEKMKKKKHLHELLEDDQEPFHLNHYIANLRSQMGFSDLRIKKRSFSAAAVFPPSFFSCESSCFSATLKSPDPRKSPLFELRPSPAKKKIHHGRVFLQIPARAAVILLEAAERIQKQQSEKAMNENRARNRGNRFKILGPVLKRLSNRKPKPRLDNDGGDAVSSGRGSEPTSSSSRRREGFLEIDDKCFCESPFHFVLQTSPSSSGHRTPHFTSTATSPARSSSEDEDSDKTESIEKVIGQEEDDKEEEDKEQCSPVSVLDPLEEEDEDDEDHLLCKPDDLDLLSCSFEVVQRAKRRLLKKLRRFEKLAGMDPGKMSEEEEESEEDDNIRVYDSDEEYEDMDDAMTPKSGCMEEEKMKKSIDERQKKWRMMSACKVGLLGVEEDVDVVVGKDMKEEAGEWIKHGDEMEEAVSDLELSIFFLLIDEFSHELMSSCQ